MVLEFAPTEKEIGQLTRGLLLRSARIYVILGVGLCSGAGVIALGNTALGAILMIALLAPVLVVFGTRRLIRKNPMATQKRRIAIADTGIDVELPSTNTHTDWDGFDQLFVDRDLYLLKRRGTTAQLLIPKRVFQDSAQETEFLRLLADHDLRPERQPGPGRRPRRLLALAIVGVAVAGLLLATQTPSTVEPASGDPGGTIMATLAALVKVVPGVATENLASFSFPGDMPATLPSTYVEKVEPGRILCGHPKTWIWLPVSLEVVFNWRGSSQTLVRSLDVHFGMIGWSFEGRNAPGWSDPGGFNLNVWGNSPAHPSKVFILSPGNGRSMQGWFEAPPATGPNDTILSCTTTSVGG
jgi:YcxB-like protein